MASSQLYLIKLTLTHLNVWRKFKIAPCEMLSFATVLSWEFRLPGCHVEKNVEYSTVNFLPNQVEHIQKCLAFQELDCNRCFTKLSVWTHFKIHQNTVSFSLNLKFWHFTKPSLCQ